MAALTENATCGFDTSGFASIDAPGAAAPGLDAASPPRDDLDRIWAWNAVVPPNIPECMHDRFGDRARRHPTATAVEASDGALTYGELDALSARLARRLARSGVGVGVFLCFEKSMWAIVAFLGALRAGATVCLCDASQPEARLQAIVEQMGAHTLLASSLQAPLATRICGAARLIVVARDQLRETPGEAIKDLPPVPATAPMYVIFTSGSTGKPKGVVISHQNYTSGAVPRIDAVGYAEGLRVFDFPSYAFDVSIDCMLCTLAAGGIVCVPSEAERVNDLSGAIRRSRANIVQVTPSVARVLDADIIPALTVLGVGGEAVSAGDAAAWAKTTRMVIGYGPSECTIACTLNTAVGTSTGIGRGSGATTWIVDPDNHNVLVPVGAVGELLVEGPIVGAGYLGEPKKTAEVFIEDPVWLCRGHGAVPGRRGRLYKTGDLVRYETNGSGSLEFVGRKDHQVKLRGQRVELAEVEHHLRSCVPAGTDVVAEVTGPDAGSPALIAFFAEPARRPHSDPNSLRAEPSPELATALAGIDNAMASRVPRYMVPAAFITLRAMPFLVSGKADRKRLREMATSLRTGVGGGRRDAETDKERKMQRAVSRALGTRDDAVDMGSSFLALGGDSLGAMRLVPAARAEGLRLSVADILDDASLADVAARATDAAPSTAPEPVEAFSLLAAGWAADDARRQTASLCDVPADAVEDVYPCSPLQEALMALSAKVDEAYMSQRVAELADAAEAAALLAALDAVRQDCAILRTRIVQVPGRGLMQAVVRSTLDCRRGSDLADYLATDRDEPMPLGAALVRCAVICDATTAKVHFVLTMHHAIYDGWSLPLIVDRVNKAYRGQMIRRPAEFRHFIKYLGSLRYANAAAYWRKRLAGAAGPQFPTAPVVDHQAEADSIAELHVPLSGGAPAYATVATVVRAAWAVVAAHYGGSADVVFGETLTGRNAPVECCEDIEGPLITTVPVRVGVNGQRSVGDFLAGIQQQVVAQIPHEHFGLQRMAKLSADAAQACRLQTGLVIHPRPLEDAKLDSTLPASRLAPAGDAEAAREAMKCNPYALMLVCFISASGVRVVASFDSRAIAPAILKSVLRHLGDVMTRLCAAANQPLDRVFMLGDDDYSQLQKVAQVDPGAAVRERYGPVTAAYIVDAWNPDSLAPLGGVGQLVVKSVADLELPFLATHPWSTRIGAGFGPGRLFETGQLARYDADGRVQFVEALVKSSASSGGQVVAEHESAQSALTSRQTALRRLWSRVLGCNERQIGACDDFFLIGGDSISAMKLASEARLEGMALTVMQMFQHRTLRAMTDVIEERAPVAAAAQQLGRNAPLSLLGVPDCAAFVDLAVRPQLADGGWAVTDVLPTRPLQQIAVVGTAQLPRFAVRYELMVAEAGMDKTRLARACDELVARNEILRTLFVQHGDQGLAVVVEHLHAPLVEYAVDSDDAVAPFARQLCQLDVLTRMPLGSAFVKWFLVSSAQGAACLVLRLSHAQYDEMCLPLLLRQLAGLYEGRSVDDLMPFSGYVGHVLRESLPASIPYWRDLLAGSSMTILKPDIPILQHRHAAFRHTFDISTRPRHVTIATIPTAAWALCLAQRLGVRDVVFGEVVSGRNTGFPLAEAVMGPCWQYVPVRVRFEAGWTRRDLLEYVQHQHAASAAHESMALGEIMTRCTDWDADTTPDWFDSVVHQAVTPVRELSFAGARARTETLYPHEEPLREWKVQAFVDGDEMTLEIVTRESWGEFAKELLQDLGRAMAVLIGEHEAPLF